jgi:hypothetical protein
MIRGLIKAGVVGSLTLFLLYFAFFVNVGRRTLFEHLSRIAQTEEAQELGEDVAGTVDRFTAATSDAGP